MNRKVLLNALMLCAFSFFGQLPEGIPAEGIQGFWSFSGNAQDLSGNLRHGVIHGVLPARDRFGNEEAAYCFNGDSAYLLTCYPGILGTKTRAVSFWAA